VKKYDVEKWPPRGRFTICHEVGHYMMHQAEEPRIYCRTGEIADDGVQSEAYEDKPVPELEADSFAAAMLMPEHLVRAHADRCGWRVEEVREEFNCSHKAMKRRLNMLRHADGRQPVSG
jgi:Zn-dependent peptidase ImmA (M78 family)